MHKKKLPLNINECFFMSCNECRAYNVHSGDCERGTKLVMEERIAHKKYDYNPSTARAYHYRAVNVISTSCIPFICERCHATLRIEVHHIDRDISNNVISNLEVLCRNCHQEEHKND